MATVYAYSPIPVPDTVNKEVFKDFGREVKGYNPSEVSEDGLKEIIDMLYKVLFCFCTLTYSGRKAEI